MSIKQTDNTNMKILESAGWKIVSSNFPSVIAAPPSPYYYSPTSINEIIPELHDSLLNESLHIYNEIWRTLAQM
jgi:hypothetical protein